jgi:hypothetical protein
VRGLGVKIPFTYSTFLFLVSNSHVSFDLNF